MFSAQAKAHEQREDREDSLRTIRALLLLLAISLAAEAGAQVNKCTVNGKVVYQQGKCEGAVAVDLSGAGQANPESTGAQQASREVANYRRQQAVELAIASGRVLIGMTGFEVTKAWGIPSKINTSVTSAGTSEQWVYRSERIGYDRYVYLDNGVVSSLQASN